MLKTNQVKCNQNSHKLRSVFWTHVNNNPIQTLIDTGSTITAISLEALMNVATDLTLYQVDDPPAKVKIANGKSEDAIQAVKLPINAIGNATYFHTTHVFTNLPVPLLLGDDFLEAHQDTLKYNGTTAELTLTEATNNNDKFVYQNCPHVEKQVLEEERQPQQIPEWTTQPQKIPAKTLQKQVIAAHPHMIDDVQYLIEAQCEEGQTIITPQITTCESQHIGIYMANSQSGEINTTLTVIATPVMTIEDVDKMLDNNHTDYLHRKNKHWMMSWKTC